MLAEEARHDRGVQEKFEAVWTRVIESFLGRRDVLAGSYELLVPAEEVPEVRHRLAAARDEARHGLAALFTAADPETDPERVRQVGSFYYAILGGLLTQWLVDPDRAPSGRDLAVALGELASSISTDATR